MSRRTHPVEIAPGQLISPTTIASGPVGATITTSTGTPRIVVVPTQVRRPTRTTIRTVFQALVALCAMAPVLVATTGLRADQLPWLGGVLAAAALVTRVMAQPQVETFLRRFVPWLAAAPKPPQD